MSELSQISLNLGDDGVFEFSRAQRIESLGAPIVWKLDTNRHTLMAAVADLGVGLCGRTRIDSELMFRLDSGNTVAARGPFSVLRCELSSADWVVLELQQTFLQQDQLSPARSAGEVQVGGIADWLKSSPFADVIEPVTDEEAKARWKDADGGNPTVVLQVDQSALEMAAWFAWALTKSGADDQDRPFWILGTPGASWRLAHDTPDAPVTPEPHWKGHVTNLSARTRGPYLALSGAGRSYVFPEPLTQAGLEEVLMVRFNFLPRRLTHQDRQLRIFSRTDTWSLGSAAWEVTLEASEQVPLPHWPRPSLDPGGRLMGTVAETWKAGSTIRCRIDGCSDAFPARLTTFDAGTSKVSGWQWVPSVGNRVKFDPDWSLGNLPCVVYAERTNAAPEPYMFEMGASSKWLLKFGRVVMQFLREGLKIG